MANTTWNPADKTASVTLSNGNLTAAATVGATGARAIDRQVTGKFYWECTTGAVWAGTNSSVGFGTQWCAQGTVATPTGALVVIKAGTIFINGSSAGSTSSAIVAGSVVGFAVDLINQLVWVRVGAAGNWNNSGTANPATAVGGFSITSIAGNSTFPMYPICAFAGATDSVTANFGDTAFTGAVPAGFTSGFTAGALIPTSAIATQSALEQFLTTDAPAQVTQVTIEQWATTATISGQAMVTQVALEQWVPSITVSNVDLAGNLGGVSHYGKLKYGVAHYSRIDAFAPAFSADLTIAPVVNLAGGLIPTIVLAADLDVHVNLIMLRGDLAPQIALEGSLSLLVPLNSLTGSFGFSVVYGASGLVAGPLWAESEPCPTPPWAESEPCPPPPWMTAPPCEPVVWSKSRLCNG